MKFARLPIGEVEDSILAHSLRVGDRILRKGTRLTAELASACAAAGLHELHVAQPAPGDVDENDAASRIAGMLASPELVLQPAANGRADLVAAKAGIVVVDREIVDRINLAQSEIQVATLAEFAAARAGQIVATVKVIPFAVGAETVALAERAVTGPAMRLAPFRPLRVGVVATIADHVKPSIHEKTRRVLAGRLAPAGAEIATEREVAHAVDAVADGLRDLRGMDLDLLILFGASATSDAADVVPAGIEAAGGSVTRIGMPVDPGNLLVLGELDGVPVIGAPGCARSPAPSGFDWVLQRTLAGLPVTAEDVARMGVGGVLAETRSSRFFAGERPAARYAAAAVILAAGRSSRMNGNHKLLARIDGEPMVRIAAEAALASAATPVIVVVGHRSDEVTASLAGLDVRIVDNPDYQTGLSSSLQVGIDAVPDDTDAAIVMLADMPDVDAKTIDTLIGAFEPDLGRHAVVPTNEGKAGNPVLWSRRFFADLMAIAGDKGARELIRAHPDAIAWVEIGPGVTHDVDTPEAMAAIGGHWPDLTTAEPASHHGEETTQQAREETW